MSEDYIQKLKRKLKPETLQKLSRLSTGADSNITSKIEELELEIQHDRILDAQRELELRLKLEKKELKMLDELHIILQKEIDKNEQPTGSAMEEQKIKTEREIKLYEKMARDLTITDDIDILGMIDMHKENEKMREKIAQLEKSMAKFAGLPPDITEAREAIKILKEEVALLQRRAQQQTEDEISKYLSQKQK